MVRYGVTVIIHDGNPSRAERKYLILKGQRSQQLSFVGGGKDSEDPDFETAALRETEEETGIPRQHYNLKKTPITCKFNYKDGSEAEQQVFFAQADQYAIENAPKAKGDYITEKTWMTEKELGQKIERKQIITVFKQAIQYL